MTHICVPLFTLFILKYFRTWWCNDSYKHHEDVMAQIFFFFPFFCAFVFLPDGYRSAQTPVATISSGPDEADMCGSACCFTAFSQAQRYGWSCEFASVLRAGVRGWLDSFAICCEKQTRNIQSAGARKTERHQRSVSQAQSWPEA